MLESHGASRILASFHDIVPNWIFAGLYFSDDYLKENPDVTRKVLSGLMKSFAYIRTNEEEARRLLPKYTKVEEELCMLAALREYSPIEPMERIAEQRQLMIDYGYISSTAALEPLIDYSFLPDELKALGRTAREDSR